MCYLERTIITWYTNQKLKKKDHVFVRRGREREREVDYGVISFPHEKDILQDGEIFFKDFTQMFLFGPKSLRNYG